MKYSPQKSNKYKGGRRPKPDAEKAVYKVGGFWLTKAEKDIYDNKFKASGLENQSEFFRRIVLRGALKLYYQDSYTEKMYYELLKIEREINSISANYNQAVKHIQSLQHKAGLVLPLEMLQQLTFSLKDKFEQIILLFETFSPSAGRLPQSTENGKSK